MHLRVQTEQPGSSLHSAKLKPLERPWNYQYTTIISPRFMNQRRLKSSRWTGCGSRAMNPPDLETLASGAHRKMPLPGWQLDDSQLLGRQSGGGAWDFSRPEFGSKYSLCLRIFSNFPCWFERESITTGLFYHFFQGA